MPRLRIVVLLIFCACTVQESQPAQAQEENVEALYSNLQSNERSQWWSATVELGHIARDGKESQKEIWDRARVNTLGMKFIEVQPGQFTMGPDDRRVFTSAVAHPVRITKPFFVQVTEVTNAQFQEFFPDFSPDIRLAPHSDSPVLNVAWEQATQFCELLSRREGAVYRLPTEAEWEFVCRAGSQTTFCFGDEPELLSEYAWWDKPHSSAVRVASLEPNRWNVYDMHGNAVEWVSDWHDTFSDLEEQSQQENPENAAEALQIVLDRLQDTYYSRCLKRGIVEDPKGPAVGRSHVLRGGGWPVQNAPACSCTARYPLSLFDRDPKAFFSDLTSTERTVGFRQAIGFRVVREAESPE